MATPKKPLSPKVRALALPDFPPVLIGALCRGRLSPLLQTFLDELKARANRLA